VDIALFDLDNTLIGGDSDHLWGEYLARVGAVPAAAHRRANDRFLRQYQAGRLDPEEFLRFQLAPLAAHPPHRLEAWRARYLSEWIEPLVLPAALRLLARHRRRGHRLVVITSTNAFITAPIARRLGVDTLLATEPERRGDRYTGRVAGTPCFGPGKVIRFREWLREERIAPRETWFYSDSRTDLPLLEVVDHPVAVDPDIELRRVASERGWPIITLRDRG